MRLSRTVSVSSEALLRFVGLPIGGCYGGGRSAEPRRMVAAGCSSEMVVVRV